MDTSLDGSGNFILLASRFYSGCLVLNCLFGLLCFILWFHPLVLSSGLNPGIIPRSYYWFLILGVILGLFLSFIPWVSL